MVLNSDHLNVNTYASKQTTFVILQMTVSLYRPSALVGAKVMVFSHFSVISWQLVLLVKETRENHRPIASH